ncbi:MAG: c-type cytochrome [Polyangiaceae bacterium]|nr:c-type cytochrome [Polyangiaceae bacterium]
MRTRNVVVLIFAALTAMACSKSEPSPGATGTTQGAAPAAAGGGGAVPAAAKEAFKARCVMCHGEHGKGDGVGAAALNPKPRNYTDKAWQKSVTDDELKKTITGGGAAVGKSAAMPAQPDLKDNPEVLDGIVKIIRGFGQ